MSGRVLKINSFIKQEISEIMRKYVDFKPEVLVTVQKVETDREFEFSRIFVSVFPVSEKDYVMKTLKKEVGLLQRKINEKLHIKKMPKLKFVYSEVGDKVDELNEVFSSEDF